MTLAQVLQRCKQIVGLIPRAPKKWEAVIYADGPWTKWNRSQQNWLYEEHAGGLRIPLDAMPEPDEREVIQRRSFRTNLGARIWIVARLRGFDHTKIVGEVRPL